MQSEGQILPFPEGQRPTLNVTAFVAALEILPVRAGEPPRIVPLNGGDPVDLGMAGGEVQIRLAAPRAVRWAPWSLSKHAATYRLFVPPALRARIQSHAGQIRVEGLEGCDLELAAGAGQIALRNVHGRLQLRADAGQIRGERIGGTLEVEASMASVRLSVDSLDRGRHRIHSGMGSVRLRLVEGLKVRIEAQTSMGSTRNRYPSTSDADVILSLETDLGSVRIDPGGPEAIERPDADSWRDRWGGADWPGGRMRHHRHHRGRNPLGAPQNPFGSPDDNAPVPPIQGPEGGPHGWVWARDRRSEPPSTSPAWPPPRQPTGPESSGPVSPHGAQAPGELERVLEMVAHGKITAKQAEELIVAMEGAEI